MDMHLFYMSVATAPPAEKVAEPPVVGTAIVDGFDASTLGRPSVRALDAAC